MTDELTIRPYRPADADAVWDVHEAALRESPMEFYPDAPADDDLRNVAAAYEDGAFLVGTVGGEVVATGGYWWEDDETVEIRRMRVRPDHQRRGFGRAMLATLEERAATAGAEQVVLWTNEHLRSARALYAEEGYREVGREPLPVGDDETVHFEKPL